MTTKSPPIPVSICHHRKRKKIIIAISAAMISAAIAANLIAYMQARAMTHFITTTQQPRTLPPESLHLLQKAQILFQGVRIPRPENTTTPASINLPFQTYRFGGPQADNCEAWFIPTTHPKALCIAFHAYASSKSSLLDAAKEFHSLNYDLLLVDFRGSGGSRGNDTTIGYREAEDVAAASNFATRQWPTEPQILYGQSMGGAAILRAIADLNIRPSAVIIESVFDRMLSTVENRFHAMGLPAFPLARLLVFWGGQQLGYSGFALNPADYATRVHCPVLMLQGGLDPRVTDPQARNLFNHLAGLKQFDEFNDAGHCMFLQTDRERWLRDVTGFLANNQ